VGQIFFPNGGSRLDNVTDKTTLDAAAAWYIAEGLRRKRPFALKCIGRCDPRGSEEFNRRLGKNRASAVASFLQRKVRERLGSDAISFSHSLDFTSMSRGESQPTGDMSVDRRVDIVNPVHERLTFSPKLILGEPPPDEHGQKQKLIELSVLSSYSAGMAPFEVAAIIVNFHDTSDGTGISYLFEGKGLGGGVPYKPFALARTKAAIPEKVNVAQLHGRGFMINTVNGTRGHLTCGFDGPRKRGDVVSTIKLEHYYKASGSFYGGDAGKILVGKWKRIPYTKTGAPKQ